MANHFPDVVRKDARVRLADGREATVTKVLDARNAMAGAGGAFEVEFDDGTTEQVTQVEIVAVL